MATQPESSHVVVLEKGITAEDVRQFLNQFGKQHLGASGHDACTLVYLPGQVDIYCVGCCQEPAATVRAGRVYFKDQQALEAGVVDRFRRHQREIAGLRVA